MTNAVEVAEVIANAAQQRVDTGEHLRLSTGFAWLGQG
jgi:hypothetical protein